jgi:hypothetical protein
MAGRHPTRRAAPDAAQEQRDAELLEDFKRLDSGCADLQRPRGRGGMKLEDYAAFY